MVRTRSLLACAVRRNAAFFGVHGRTYSGVIKNCCCMTGPRASCAQFALFNGDCVGNARVLLSCVGLTVCV